MNHIVVVTKGDYGPLLVQVTGEDLSADARWDGCVHLWRHYESDPDPDYMHICELRRHIEFLQEVLKAGEETFKNEYWGRG